MKGGKGREAGGRWAVTCIALKAWFTDPNLAITWPQTPNVTLPGAALLLVSRMTPSSQGAVYLLDS